MDAKKRQWYLDLAKSCTTYKEFVDKLEKMNPGINKDGQFHRAATTLWDIAHKNI